MLCPYCQNELSMVSFSFKICLKCEKIYKITNNELYEINLKTFEPIKIEEREKECEN